MREGLRGEADFDWPADFAGGANDPSRSSFFGIIDLARFPKDRLNIYQAKWRPSYPMAHVRRVQGVRQWPPW
jgi:hypothetical protein